MLFRSSVNDVTAALGRVLADDQIKVTRIDSSRASPPSPLRTDVIALVEKVVSSLWPGVPVTPTMVTGATDGVYLRAAGIPVYGLSGMFTDIDDVRAHGRDERIGVREFYEGVEFTYRLMKEVGK